MGAAAEYDPSLAVLGFPGSALLAAAEREELEAVPEGFVDRAYLARRHVSCRARSTAR